MTWIANELSRLGLPLKAGQVITTGTCVTPLEVEPGDRVEAEIEAIGTMTLDFA